MERETSTLARLSRLTREELLRRNGVLSSCSGREASRLAAACLEMSRRFQEGGRLLACGRGAAATDAGHVSVEFVHPVIVGKRALPALDLGPEFEAVLPALLTPRDMVMGFAFAPPDAAVDRALAAARRTGALTFGLASEDAEYCFDCPDPDPFVTQEVFEVLYHVLWETVHVFFEHREQSHDIGASAFLYPFLGRGEQDLTGALHEVEASVVQKAAEVNRLRSEVAETEGEKLVAVAAAISERVQRGGKVLTFGNGGSATDAGDFALDCAAPPAGLAPIPAVSLSAEAANVTAVANDIGSEAIFARQVIAHGQPGDVAVAFSTSGGSANILAALAEARRRGLLTVGLTGYDGGRMVSEGLADHLLVVRSDHIPRIQEVQASLYHVLRRRIDDFMRGHGRA